MAGKTYRVVKLLKNHIYPTYQLFATMANDKTAPEDGLRLAALTTMHWLKARLDENAPESWASLPEPSDYLSTTDDDLPSLYLNQGHVINIVSLPDKGVWTLQITEPDLGSDPGNPDQSRQAIPGRIIETNIAFQIVGSKLECGFKTVISDTVGTTPEAEVYRLAVIGQLMRNKAFGLKQVLDIPLELTRLDSVSAVKTMNWVVHHAENQLPAIVFTQLVEEQKEKPKLPDINSIPQFTMRSSALSFALKDLPDPKGIIPSKPIVTDPPYDLEKFAYYTFSHCRTYLLEQSVFKTFTDQSGISFQPGEIVVIYPTSLGGGSQIIPFRKSADRQGETIQDLEHKIKAFTKDHPIDFGHIMFLSGAREHLLHLSDELLESAETADAHFKQELEQLNNSWQDELAQKNKELDALASQLQRQKEYAASLEEEKSKLREDFSKEQEKKQVEIESYKEMIAFLRRKKDQPRDYFGIANWVERYFSDRLYLHPKAIERLEAHSSPNPSAELICDALDYLATDYWELRYHQIPKEVALTRCGEKYGRPFDVSPVGSITIGYTPAEYRIKYFKNAQGKLKESDLNCHLRVGNDPENLLRIYFLHDDDKQLIVIGSLPDHLSSVKVK